MRVSNQQLKELARYKAALEDMAEYSPYTESRKKAAAILDLSTEFKPSPPKRTTGG